MISDRNASLLWRIERLRQERLNIDADIAKLEAAMQEDLATFDEWWQSDDAALYRGHRMAVCPSRWYGNRPPSNLRICTNLDDRGFVEGDRPVLMSGSRTRVIQSEPSNRAWWAKRMSDRIVRRQRRTIWFRNDWEEYRREVAGIVLAYFRKRYIPIHSNSVDAVFFSRSSHFGTVGIDMDDDPSFLLDGVRHDIESPLLWDEAATPNEVHRDIQSRVTTIKSFIGLDNKLQGIEAKELALFVERKAA